MESVQIQFPEAIVLNAGNITPLTIEEIGIP